MGEREEGEILNEGKMGRGEEMDVRGEVRMLVKEGKGKI